jgi:hypothetical protein
MICTQLCFCLSEIVVHKRQQRMKKSENQAKLSKGCKKGLKNVCSSQNIQC